MSKSEGGARNGAPRRWARGGAWQVALLALAAVALPLMALGVPAVPAAARSAVAEQRDSTALAIVNPPGNAGPAGTNVRVSITGAHRGQVFVIGYASSSSFPTQCLQGFQAIPNAQTVTIGSSGSSTFTISWPSESGVGSFNVCARDANNPLTVLQSDQPFNVLSTTAPSVKIAPAPQPTPTPGGTPAAAPSLPEGTYQTGDQVLVTGDGFLPGGSSVQIYLSSSAGGQGTQISTSAVNADVSGKFSTVVTLPGFRTGSLFIQAATADASDGQPPSLLAATPIRIILPPTPTPTPTATVSPTPGGAATPTPPETGGNGSLRILGIAGLGSLSVLLLLVGAALLISANGPRRG